MAWDNGKLGALQRDQIWRHGCFHVPNHCTASVCVTVHVKVHACVCVGGAVCASVCVGLHVFLCVYISVYHASVYVYVVRFVRHGPM